MMRERAEQARRKELERSREENRKRYQELKAVQEVCSAPVAALAMASALVPNGWRCALARWTCPFQERKQFDTEVATRRRRVRRVAAVVARPRPCLQADRGDAAVRTTAHRPV